MHLVVGATGLVGRRVCELLRERGLSVRALVRDTAHPDKVAALRGVGAELVTGDLKEPASVLAACRGVDTVVSTASSTLSRQAGDSIDAVDRHGQMDLVAAADAAGAKRFVLISFPPSPVEFPLQTAKRAVEDRLRHSRMTHTVLQPTFFTEVWLSPAVGFDAVNGTARIYGSGRNKISWISFEDVARFAAAVVDSPRAANATIKLGGPEALNPLEVVHIAEETTGRRFAVEHVPEEALRAQLASAPDSLQKSFAGLMLNYAAGEVIDMSETCRAFGVQALKSVRDHFRAMVAASGR